MSRHRKYQIAITLGVVVSTILSIWSPDLGHHAAFVAIATNIAWIWEA